MQFTYSWSALCFRKMFIICLLPVLIGCGSGSKNDHSDDDSAGEQFDADLNAIKARGKLRAMTAYGATSYFLYRGQPMGFEYELLKRFANHLDVDLEIVVSRDLDSLIYALESGEVDVLAHGLTITTDRQKRIAFTDHLYQSHQVLVQRKPDNWRSMHWSKLQASLIHDPIQLLGDTISVRRNSSYMQRLRNLSQEMGGEIVIDTLPGHLSTEEIIHMVANAKIKYTVADDNLASINASYFPNLHAELPISFSQRMAWAVHREATDLLEVINEWIADIKTQSDYHVIYNNYFRSSSGFKRRVDSEFYSLSNQAISPYDDLIKMNAERIGWDWRLLAAIVYQESKFDPMASAWTEASGLMQLMPATADELGILDLQDPAENLRGGANYLRQIWRQFEDVPDSLNRIKFTLAAYNCGYGHVKDAQRLAEKEGRDPNLWSGSVGEMILNLSYPKYYNDPVVYYGYVRGVEAYAFVEEIFERYRHYKRFTDTSTPTAQLPPR